MRYLFGFTFVIWIVIWGIGILYAILTEGFDFVLIAVFLIFTIVAAYGYDLFMNKTARKIKFAEDEVTFVFFNGSSYKCHKTEIKKIEVAPKGEILHLNKKKIHTLKSMLEIETVNGNKEKRQVKNTDFPSAQFKRII